MADDNRATVRPHMLPLYEGKFSWSQATLNANIKAKKPDHDPYNPATWPRMTMSQLTISLGMEYSGIVALPIGLAYDQQVYDKYQFFHKTRGSIRITQISTGTQVRINPAFYYFPFLYGRFGTPYQKPGLLAINREHWMEKVTGVAPTKEGKPMVEKSSLEKPSMGNPLAKKPSVEKPESSAAALEEVLRMMNESPSLNSAQVAALENDIAALKTQLADRHKLILSMKLQHHTALASLADELEVASSSKAALSHDLAALKTKLSSSETLWKQSSTAADRRAAAAEKRVGFLEQAAKQNDQQLAEKSKQLEAAQKEAVNADERVMKIWAEMKRTKATENGKRKGSENPSTAQAKKLKLV
ncbi:hypothetical protein C7974DRAFT_168665 [Boeremia exigua]|uniref:uncharacterized protein n=1 Tax=Boeremia exigua TaxID=749465 RepID=UPI001E8CEDEA|nr:uncharacterized protein C7974DRAFT_168665 [Boeremia exigua]KAH6633283.1 hypothetical protein C7974DRAFT_168665 [Boeremia exigua]